MELVSRFIDEIPSRFELLTSCLPFLTLNLGPQFLPLRRQTLHALVLQGGEFEIGVAAFAGVRVANIYVGADHVGSSVLTNTAVDISRRRMADVSMMTSCVLLAGFASGAFSWRTWLSRISS